MSIFYITQLVEKLADTIEIGVRDQHSDVLVRLLASHIRAPLCRKNNGAICAACKLLLMCLSYLCVLSFKVADVNSHFEKCQNLLNSIASATASKNMVISKSSIFFYFFPSVLYFVLGCRWSMLILIF